jgi:hypothetical protein
LGLKKASQFALICAAAAGELPLAEADGAADMVEVGAAVLADARARGLGELLLLHAATATAAMTLSTGTRKNR